MRGTTKTQDERKAERRDVPERREDAVRAGTGERRVVEKRGLAASMVDALDDIMKWERASERSIKAAQPSGTDSAAS